jgi:hypothetical protein
MAVPRPGHLYQHKPALRVDDNAAMAGHDR